MKNISTHTPHTGCDEIDTDGEEESEISTHTPHTGCDPTNMINSKRVPTISTHTPHTGCDRIKEME